MGWGMGHGTPSPMRLVAPAALALFGVVFLIVLFSSSSDEETSSPEEAVNESGQLEEGGEKTAGATDAKRYTVESGDTLDSIAEKTGIDVDELQALNPDLDAQALVGGQKIKLQE